MRQKCISFNAIFLSYDKSKRKVYHKQQKGVIIVGYRKIIEIHEEKCDGCGICIPNCPEGAMQIIDGKARLVSDLFCDGLGACIGSCPHGAIEIIEREAEPYDEKQVMEKIVKQGANVISAHLQHLKDHGENGLLIEALSYLEENGIENPFPTEKIDKNPQELCGCPGSKVMNLSSKKESVYSPLIKQESQLSHWPVQLTLIPPHAPFLNNADLLIAADCVPFTYANFHQELLKDKSLIICCPKLDNVEPYKEKLTEILRNNNIKSVTVAIMEVPCCFGLVHLIDHAISSAEKRIEKKEVVISIKGEIKQR
ncbi:4Fe-4S binding protein [bacterium]|nr:4Fe-4S binding protein [bacterium]